MDVAITHASSAAQGRAAVTSGVGTRGHNDKRREAPATICRCGGRSGRLVLLGSVLSEEHLSEFLEEGENLLWWGWDNTAAIRQQERVCACSCRGV